VASIDSLRQSFDAAADGIIRADAGEQSDLLDQAADNLLKLVKVRPVGDDIEGDDVASVVARAESRLGDGDVTAAITELETLQGAPADAAAGWIATAKARLDAEAATSALRAHAQELLAKGS
jgi:hypothetical protein